MEAGLRTVGVIGLGAMGTPMARNLLAAGFAVHAYNRSAAPVDALVASGAQRAASPATLAAACDTVLTMLPDGAAVGAVLDGPEGVLAGARAGTLLIDTSTISPLDARTLAARAGDAGLAFVDAPVSGGPEGAAERRLSIMAGGAREDVKRAQPILAALGTTVTYCGPSGSGQIVKACNQLVVAIHIEAAAEAITLAERSGVDAAAMIAALRGGLAASRVLEVRGDAMVARDFAPRGKARFHRKDLGFVRDLARASSTTLPLAAVVERLYDALLARGRGDLDHTALLTLLDDGV